MAAPIINDLQFNDMVLEADGPVLVDFYSDYCPPCKALAPIMDRLAVANPGRVVKMNVMENESPQWLNITSLPTVILFDKGKIKQVVPGLKPAAYYQGMLVA